MSKNRFENLKFDDFRRMAKDTSLSCYEKIGFPDTYRAGKETLIFQDILHKLSLLQTPGQVVLDIGPGCSELPLLLIEHCRNMNHTLILVDCEEMLALLPDEPFIHKVCGPFPASCQRLLEQYQDKINVILTYSVLQIVFLESNMWDFLDSSLMLLAEGGEMLIGDLPNVSKRKRFFSSNNGIRFHQQFTGTETLPDVVFNRIERHLMDDGVILGMLARIRNQGFDAYLLPQADNLPMANRREDMLIRRP